MKRSIATFLFAALAASTAAQAQDTTVFFEDFENGSTPGWTLFSYTQLNWRLVQNGECGAVTSMMACNYPGACDYYGAANGQAVILETPTIFLTSPNPGSALFSFDYILDVDATGDHMTVYVTSIVAPYYPFVADLHLVADGALHTITMDVQLAATGPFNPNNFGFQFLNDGIGDGGRGLMIDNVRLSMPSPANLFCEPTAASPCPCAPSGPLIAGRGCPSSLGFGALLRGAGNPSVSADSYRLTAASIPNGSPVLFFEGTAQFDVPFGDGRLCTGGGITRLGVRIFANGTPVLPDISELPISALAPETAGGTRYYQVFYRDPAGTCGSGFNLTSGWSTTWGP